MKTSILTLALVISSFANANNDGEIKEKQKINYTSPQRFWKKLSNSEVFKGFTIVWFIYT